MLVWQCVMVFFFKQKTAYDLRISDWSSAVCSSDLLGLQADTIQIDDFRVSREGEHVIDIRRVRGGLDAREGSLHLKHVVVDSDRGRFTAHGDYVPDDDYRMQLAATAVLPVAAGT